MVVPLLFALALSAAPSPVQADEFAACPSRPPYGRDPEDLITEEEGRAACLKQALERAERHVAPAVRGPWDVEEATFEPWVAKACRLAGKLRALDLEKRRWQIGPPGPVAERHCLQNAYGERGYLAKHLAAFRPDATGAASKEPFLAEVLARVTIGARERLQLAKVLAVAREAPDGSRQPGGLSSADWVALAGTIDEVWQGAQELAVRGCERGQVTSLCLTRLEAYYFSLLSPPAPAAERGP